MLAAEEFPMLAGADGDGEDSEDGGFDSRLLGLLRVSSPRLR